MASVLLALTYDLTWSYPQINIPYSDGVYDCYKIEMNILPFISKVSQPMVTSFNRVFTR